MDRFHAMKVFARVVEESSFSGAADRLGMPRPTVSVIVKNLEAFLKVRLLQRTTRRVRLTHDGAAYYERCVRILADVDQLVASFRLVPNLSGSRARRGFLMGGSGSAKVQISGRDE